MKTIKFLFLALFLLSLTGISAQTYNFTSPQGYGAAATGGGTESTVPKSIVTTMAELKTALTASGKGVVIVKGSIQCDYLSVLVTDKTLLGLPGAKLYTDIRTAGASGILYLKAGSNNVIIRNLLFVGPGAYDVNGRDCLTNEGTNIWVDHCEFQDGMDGNFDNKGKADNVTVTWCKFTYLKPPKAGGSGGTDDHRFSNLIGSSSSDYPTDKKYNITWQNCWWASGCVERMTRARNAQLHLVNCYWNSSVAKKCLGLEDGSNGTGTQVYLEGGVFETPSGCKNIDVSYGGTPDVTVKDCIGSGLADNSSAVSKPSYTYTTISSSEVIAAVTSSCGAGANLQITEAGVISTSCGTTNIAVTGVSLTPTSATIGIAATSQLTATVAPSNATNKTVSWSSSNTSVATVSSSGLVTGVAAGSATITVKTTDGAKTATCAITVTSTTVPVTGVTVSPTSSTITSANGTVQLTATVAPSNATNKNVTWTSSNTAVATVSSTGLVTGKTNGSATITVSTSDGGKTATCAITVNIGTTPTESIVHNFTTSGKTSTFYTITGNLSTTKGTVTYSGLTLTQCLKIESATSIVFTAAQAGVLTLVFNNDFTGNIMIDGVASANASAGIIKLNVAAGKHTLTKGATANLYYMSLSYDALKSSMAENNMQESNAQATFGLFPNPVYDLLTIELDTELAEGASIQLYDNVGKVILKQEVQGTTHTINVSNLRSGLYIVKISNAKANVIKQLIKK